MQAGLQSGEFPENARQHAARANAADGRAGRAFAADGLIIGTGGVARRVSDGAFADSVGAGSGACADAHGRDMYAAFGRSGAGNAMDAAAAATHKRFAWETADHGAKRPFAQSVAGGSCGLYADGAGRGL